MTTLYHGTTEAIAKMILESDGLIPAATKPAIANPAFVYLAEDNFLAVAFGYARLMVRSTQTRKGVPVLNKFQPGKKYDRIALVEVESKRLDESLLRKSDRHSGFRELAYEGVVPVSALTRIYFIQVNKQLADSVGKLFTNPIGPTFEIIPHETWEVAGEKLYKLFPSGKMVPVERREVTA